MPNLPEDIVDRVKRLERQVQQLTARMQAAAPAVRTAAPPGAAADGAAAPTAAPPTAADGAGESASPEDGAPGRDGDGS
ncbi:hypothetical protein [Streptomyces sp. NPDC050504]|uniref:hypothetical protein n=1 Tax=Streptomyces sp. NPDC050504 TaxID=3365618 RepID=UPI0037B855D0